MQSKRIDIAISFKKNLAEEISKQSSNLAKISEPYFILDSKNFYPHISIYSIEIPQKNLSKIFNSIEETISTVKPFKLKFNGYEIRDGYVVLFCDKSLELKKLHRKILDEINPLRDNLIRDKYKDQSVMDKLTAKEKKYAIEYGYPGVLDLYRPHLTLIRYIKDIEIDKVLYVLNSKWKLTEIEVNAITVFEMQSSGTCVKILKDFIL